MKKLTSYTINTTAEGVRAAYTYSVIDDSGNVTAQNKRSEIILLDESILETAQVLYDYLSEKLSD